MKRISESAAWQSLRVFLVGISLARIFVPTFDLFYEEEIMEFLNCFDSNLFIWIIYIWILGQTLKKVSLPKWMPPTPIILLLASFTICSLFGWSHTTATGSKAVFISVVEYGLGNGILVWLASTSSYDVGHTFIRDKWEGIKTCAIKVCDSIKKKIAEKKAKKVAKKVAEAQKIVAVAQEVKNEEV